MASFGELKADIASELNRDDLAAQIPRFIRQATQRINRQIRTSSMEERVRSFGNGTRYLESPEGFLEMRRMWNVVDLTQSETGSAFERKRKNAIQQVSPQALLHRTGGGNPSFFCVHRGEPPELEFDAPLADDREVEMLYTFRVPEFVNDADTNFLLDTHFDLYFQGALIEGARYVKDWEEARERKEAFGLVFQEVWSEQRRRVYAQPMAATPAHNAVG